MNDLFVVAPPKTKKEQILNYIKQKQWARTSDVIKFGLSIFTNRGDRYARELAEEVKIKRMADEFKAIRFGRTREEVWEYIDLLKEAI